jgi:hypothetical protein
VVTIRSLWSRANARSSLSVELAAQANLEDVALAEQILLNGAPHGRTMGVSRDAVSNFTDGERLLL